MIIEGKIESLAFGGHGILRADGLVVFIPFSAPGDLLETTIVQKKRSHAHGRIACIKDPSPLRTTPPCPLFGSCGGCQLQHLTYDAQLEAKRQFVQDALQRIGGLSFTVPPVTPSSFTLAYRRHIKLSLRSKGPGFEAGFLGTDNTTFLPISSCPIFNEPKDPIISQVQQFLATLPNNGMEKGELRLLKAPDKKFHLAFNLETLPHETEKLCTNALKKWTSWQSLYIKTLKTTMSFGITQSCYDILGLKIMASPLTFLQNHPEQSANIYRTIQNSFSSDKILDLYCGVGVTSLLLGKAGKKVVGIEWNPSSIAFAKENIFLNQIKEVTFIAGRTEEETPRQLQQFQPGGVLLNPPRTGVDPELLHTLGKAHVSEIVYISCMPSTLARDLKILCQDGYKVSSVQAFDMFPQTTHVETVVKLQVPIKFLTDQEW
ncbi:MAG TPA: 23S rRNA (uracil(1939)-C(5))-methyltransferase RlmD [Rhabdochlamydiaceae bacterium]|nr:23S rRNA (uracil(1939)-C(5))-methyltransferase RlmD [Rhabdochlamydiaceae bacterium]